MVRAVPGLEGACGFTLTDSGSCVLYVLTIQDIYRMQSRCRDER